MKHAFTVKFIDSLLDYPKAHWQALLSNAGINYPFIQYDFLAALERSGSCSKATGWKARHILVFDKEDLVALMPCYEKTHSYGEYVFDQQWAQAFEQNRLPYYPKLVTAIPFTPCVGPRLVIANDINPTAIEACIISAIERLCAESHYSGWHYLFYSQAKPFYSQTHQTLLAVRQGVQFHWYNRDYSDFNHFLESFTSRKRKAVLKERRKVIEQGFEIVRVEGVDASDDDWQRFFHFYQLTYAKRSGHSGYLNQAFFSEIAQHFAKHCLLIFAKIDEKIVAGALYFKDSENLYGRYWGCYEEFDFLHFECCYYQGIEYCIEHSLKHIDAGAQGEHKIQRGFEPITTYSQHFVPHKNFFSAITQFTEEESEHIQLYKAQCEASLPYKTA